MRNRVYFNAGVVKATDTPRCANVLGRIDLVSLPTLMTIPALDALLYGIQIFIVAPPPAAPARRLMFEDSGPFPENKHSSISGKPFPSWRYRQCHFCQQLSLLYRLLIKKGHDAPMDIRSPNPKATLITALLILLAGLTICRPATAACSKPVSVGWSAWAPYQQQDDNGTMTGIDISLIRAILEQAGCKYAFRQMPWKRVVAEIQAGTLDLALGASLTPEREQFAYFTKPYRREYMVLFMRQRDIPQRPLARLADVTSHLTLRFAALRGSWYGEEFDHLQKNDDTFQRQLHLNNDYILLFKWLAIGRMDVVVNDLYNGLSLIRQLEKEDVIGVHPLIVNDNFVHFMLSRKTMTQSDVEVINSANSHLRDKGLHKEIFSRHIPKQYADFFPQ